MSSENEGHQPNRLIHETSPYLRQHANNPVDWYPWGEEALEKAKKEDKPIFLSIGYAACHWCHVMEHESFEDEQTAQLLNEHFVSIKVDREERPDLDSIYMNALVAMTGQGGWPMSLFLTPQGEPFYGGTYFPSTQRYGMPSFKEVLSAVSASWQNERDEIQRVGQELTQHLRQNNRLAGATGAVLHPGALEQAAQALIDSYDWQMGGWGSAPRFPQPMVIEFLLMQATRGVPKTLEAASHVLTRMIRGGMYDIVGGGFHRYSTDDQWLTPHFEKMLYDNGQLALVYLHAFLLTGEPAFRQTCLDTLDFIRGEMTHPAGGFFSSLDADSEGEEGKYYLWTPDEIAAALPGSGDRELFNQVYTLTPQGNLAGRALLRRKDDLGPLAERLGLPETELIQRLSAVHQQLYAAREQRVRPLTDDKVLVAWNALALQAFAEAARYLQRPDYLETARKNARFLLEAVQPDGRLRRAWRDGQTRHYAGLEDHAGLVLALLDLYQSDPDPRWYTEAVRLTEAMQANFRDPAGGFFDTPNDQGGLIVRPKELQDNAVPSGSALAVNALLRLSAFDERGNLREQAEAMLAPMQAVMLRYPTSFAGWLEGLDFAVGPVRQVALVGPENAAMLDAIWRTYRPRLVVAAAPQTSDASTPGLLLNREMLQGKTTAYVCEGFVCHLPVNTPEGLQEQLER